MSIDVWNLAKTRGINAEICAGNVDRNISYILNSKPVNDTDFPLLNWLNVMDHAWVIAEPEPFKYIALETTGGYFIWNEDVNVTNMDEVTKNDLYYFGTCFNTPSEFKRFSEVRMDILEVCQDAIEMENDWNENYVGKRVTESGSEYKGKVEQKEEECKDLISEMKGLIV